MRSFPIQAAGLATVSLGLAGAASAADVLVTSNIAVSTTWTADNTYNLQNQIYVLPGATLTIEAGTVVASDTGIGGSLAIARGGQIHVLGTKSRPVIMTSTADVATWTNNDPTTGVWREAINEWGNLTIMGRGYVSEDAVVGNVPTPTPSNVGAMEGLVAAFPGDPNVLYGGGDDDDDSGSIRFLSLRYGGRVIGLNNELNGISLGGIGRGTDIDHVEIMNNVDDGFELWGGTVNLKHFSIWNIGDDSLDVDQGWRGRAQFGLIVQGHSANAAQGSGVGDNAIEIDGAENSDWQPVTTATIYNVTVIGQPVDGDHGTAWRDNARAQFRNCIFMDLGERLVAFDNIDGDGGAGYGHNGTLSWPDTWTTAFSVTSPVNAPANPALFYTAQVDGMLAEIRDSVFFRNLNASAYTIATDRGVFQPINNNVLVPGFATADEPIASITRGPAVVVGGRTMLPVIGLDPRAANAAVMSVASAPSNGFYTPAPYRGGFDSSSNPTWLCGWTASEAFGFTQDDCIGENYCVATLNSTGAAACLQAVGSTAVSDNDVTLVATQVPQNAFGYFLTSQNQGTATPPGSQGVLCLGAGIGRYVAPGQIQNAGAAGAFVLQLDLTQHPTPAGLGSVTAGETWNFQGWFRDQNPNVTSNLTDGLEITFN